MQPLMGGGGGHAIAERTTNPPVVIPARFSQYGADRKRRADMRGWKGIAPRRQASTSVVSLGRKRPAAYLKSVELARLNAPASSIDPASL